MKLYAIVINEALEHMGHNRGKIAAQCGHAFVGCMEITMKNDVSRWNEYKNSNYMAKVVLCGNLKSAKKIMKELENKVPFVLITDAGLTVFDKPTQTVLGVGPIRDEEMINKIKGLPLLI